MDVFWWTCDLVGQVLRMAVYAWVLGQMHRALDVDLAAVGLVLLCIVGGMSVCLLVGRVVLLAAEWWVTV